MDADMVGYIGLNRLKNLNVIRVLTKMKWEHYNHVCSVYILMNCMIIMNAVIDVKTHIQCTEYYIPESKEECEEIACFECFYFHGQSEKCFENRWK